MNIKYIYTTKGKYQGFIVKSSIFNRDGNYLGWIENEIAWYKNGQFAGFLLQIPSIKEENYFYILHPRLSIEPPARPSKEENTWKELPDPPPNIPPREFDLEYSDAFDL